MCPYLYATVVLVDLVQVLRESFSANKLYTIVLERQIRRTARRIFGPYFPASGIGQDITKMDDRREAKILAGKDSDWKADNW